MSSLTHCSHVFLPLPRPLAPSTTNLLQADTQSSTLLRSRCPNHLNLPRLTTSATQLIPRRLLKSSLRFLSFQGHPTHPPHHHTLCPFQTFQIISLHCPGFSSIYQNTLDTSTIDPSLDTIRCTTHSQNRRKLLELSPSTIKLITSCWLKLSQDLPSRPFGQ